MKVSETGAWRKWYVVMFLCLPFFLHSILYLFLSICQNERPDTLSKPRSFCV
jgi:hypothetical protein